MKKATLWIVVLALLCLPLAGIAEETAETEWIEVPDAGFKLALPVGLTPMDIADAGGNGMLWLLDQAFLTRFCTGWLTESDELRYIVAALPMETEQGATDMLMEIEAFYRDDAGQVEADGGTFYVFVEGGGDGGYVAAAVQGNEVLLVGYASVAPGAKETLLTVLNTITPLDPEAYVLPYLPLAGIAEGAAETEWIEVPEAGLKLELPSGLTEITLADMDGDGTLWLIERAFVPRFCFGWYRPPNEVGGFVVAALPLETAQDALDTLAEFEAFYQDDAEWVEAASETFYVFLENGGYVAVAAQENEVLLIAHADKAPGAKEKLLTILQTITSLEPEA